MNNEWTKHLEQGMRNSLRAQELCGPPPNDRTLANEMIDAAGALAERSEAISERLAQRLYGILLASYPEQPCPGGIEAKQSALPPLFEEMGGKMRRVNAALDMIEDIINRCGV